MLTREKRATLKAIRLMQDFDDLLGRDAKDGNMGVNTFIYSYCQDRLNETDLLRSSGSLQSQVRPLKRYRSRLKRSNLPIFYLYFHPFFILLYPPNADPNTKTYIENSICKIEKDSG